MARSDQFCTEDYGTRERLAHVQAFVQKGFADKGPLRSPARPHISVIERSRQTISKPHGFWTTELRIASEAGHYIEGLRLPLWYAVLADRWREEREVRALVRELKSDILQAQREVGTPPFWLEMCEGAPAFHSNILFPLGGSKAERLIARIARSKLYPGDLLSIQAAEGSDWFVSYCSKERTPQARFLGGLKMSRRLKGSHPLGQGGGDRVRLSKGLQTALVQENRIEPYRRLYASRSLPRIAQNSCDTDISVTTSALSRPPHRKAQKSSPPAQPIQLELAFDLKPAPPLLKLVEEKRLALNLTQREAAQRLGIKQPAYSNAVVRQHDRLSPWALNRARAFVAERLAA